MWKYKSGNWTHLSNFSPNEVFYFLNDEELFEDSLTRQGFWNYPQIIWGKVDPTEALQARLYMHAGARAVPCLIELSIGYCIEYVLIDDFVALMEWIREYLPAVIAPSRTYIEYIEETNELKALE